MKWRAETLVLRLVLAALGALGALSCRQKMADQPAYRPLQASEFWGDGRSARDPVPGTVARGHLMEDEVWTTGKRDGAPINVVPARVDRAMLERGRDRYDIFCAPCHDRAGEGLGMVVRRGFPQPPSLHIGRLRDESPGYLFDVITNGFGRQMEMADQIPVADRWAIVAYIKVLQYAQHAPLSSVPADERGRLDAQRPNAAPPATPGAEEGKP